MAATLTARRLDRRRVGQAVWALGAAYAWTGLASTLPVPQLLEHAHGGLAAAVPLAWLVSPWVVGAASIVVYALLAGSWAWRDRRPAVLAALPLVFLLFFVFARVEGATDRPTLEHLGHGKYLAAVSALAMTFGHVLGRRAGDADGGERRAVSYASGIVAVLYVWAGLIKLWVAGPQWFTRANVSMLAYERGLYAPWPLDALRAFVGVHPWIGTVGAVLVVAIELCGVAFLYPRWRSTFAAAETVMHLLIASMVDYIYIEWMLGVWGLALWSDALQAADDRDAAPPRP